VPRFQFSNWLRGYVGEARKRLPSRASLERNSLLPENCQVRKLQPFFLFLLSALAASAVPAQSSSSPASAREIFQSLNALRANSKQVYFVRDLLLRRDVVRLDFIEGKLAFLTAFDGRITGAVFTGRGRALAFPRDPIEKASLGRFLGSPLLDQPFSRAYLRFNDSTAEELFRQIHAVEVLPSEEPSFGAEWDTILADLNTWHSLRLLFDILSESPRPFFYAGLHSEFRGAFDVLVDQRLSDQILIGQLRWVEGTQYYDVWASFPTAEPAPPLPSFQTIRYVVDTSIQPDLQLEATATLTLQAVRGGERIIPLELSRLLKVRTAEDDAGRPLTFFQNEALNRHEIAQRGNDAVILVLPEAPPAGSQLRLRLSYHGGVISDAGNGVYFVGERGIWYPQPAGQEGFAPFELSFRWPRRLQLMATGTKLEEHEDGEWKTGRWRSDQPMVIAGFNLGDYLSERTTSGSLRVEVYANRNLERALQDRLRQTVVQPIPPSLARGPRGVPSTSIILTEPPPSPALVLGKLGADVADAVRFFERYGGPFPYPQLAVSQIPGVFGQGWPGLLYLSTLTFLTPEDHRRVGTGERTQDFFTELLPFHEVAHQWWGNQVTYASYRDQWIQEGLSNYLAMLYADAKKPKEQALSAWLDRYRSDLLAEHQGTREPYDLAGPLILGYRLRSSLSPDAYERVIYGKGAWVFHMLRMMVREPAAKDPDARFTRLLRSLLERYRHRTLTNAQFQRAVENVMTPAMDLEGTGSMDWFFDQWVHSTGIPHYSVEFTSRPVAGGFQIRGTLRQSEVPESFVAAVPIYAGPPVGKPIFLGTVVTSGEETRFQFTSRFRPKRLLLDPQRTLLCVTDRKVR